MKVDGSAALIGVIGCPIAHTKSPVMHNTAIATLGLNLVYIPILVQTESALQPLLSGIKQTNFIGLNVTVPYKTSIIALLDELDEMADITQAVNTITNHDGILKGYNTDGDGFLMALSEEKKVTVEGLSVVILGAGGSARSISMALAKRGVKSLTILNRTKARAEWIQKRIYDKDGMQIQIGSYQDDKEMALTQLKSADIVINTTSVGMAPNPDDCPIDDFSWVSTGQLCCDIIYAPPDTMFLQSAKAKGATVMGGAGMLAGQGVIAFKKITEKEIPYHIMRSVL